jgi:hypothetical protein
MLFVNINTLTFSVWPFTSHVSVAARALVNLNAHCGTVLSVSDRACTFNRAVLSQSPIKG